MVDSFTMGQLSAYCYMVERGKPCTKMIVKREELDDVIEYIESTTQLHYYVKSLSNDWRTVYIYKYKFIEKIIEQIPKEPSTVFDHWVLGKLFGYSDETIEQYMQNNVSDYLLQ